MRCDCREYSEAMCQIIEAQIRLGEITEWHFQGPYPKYCAWCGKPLKKAIDKKTLCHRFAHQNCHICDEIDCEDNKADLVQLYNPRGYWVVVNKKTGQIVKHHKGSENNPLPGIKINLAKTLVEEIISVLEQAVKDAFSKKEK